MKYAIIAAGHGSRLKKEGLTVPKPLVKIGGECLIGRLIRIFRANGATEVVTICNEQAAEVREFLEGTEGVRTIVRSTPSSMHSLFEISRVLSGEPFILTTVDTVFREDEFARYADCFASARETDALMGVTRLVDDERPLYVSTDEAMNVRGFFDEGSADCRFVSAGIYGLTPPAMETLARCVERGESRMRNFQRALIADGLRVRAYAFSDVMDVDHAGDVPKAETLVREGRIGR